MSDTKSIGQRISYAQHTDSFTVVITQEIPQTSFRLLCAWWFAWCGIGGVFIWQWSITQIADERVFYAICIAFWAYFLFRVGKVIAWRKWGKELIRITPHALSLKNAFGSYGRAFEIPLNSIDRMEVVKPDPKKFLQSLDQSFWIMGGDRLFIKSKAKRIPLGKQISEREAGALAKVIDGAIRKMRKLDERL